MPTFPPPPPPKAGMGLIDWMVWVQTSTTAQLQASYLGYVTLVYGATKRVADMLASVECANGSRTLTSCRCPTIGSRFLTRTTPFTKM